MTNFYVILVATTIGNFLVALYNTLNKEKQLIKEGGTPLPTSSYLFLVLKYALWCGVIASTDLLSFAQPSKPWGLLFFALGVIVSTYIVATILEVLVRVVIYYIYSVKVKRDVVKKLNKTGKDN